MFLLVPFSHLPLPWENMPWLAHRSWENKRKQSSAHTSLAAWVMHKGLAGLYACEHDNCLLCAPWNRGGSLSSSSKRVHLAMCRLFQIQQKLSQDQPPFLQPSKSLNLMMGNPRDLQVGMPCHQRWGTRLADQAWAKKATKAMIPRNLIFFFFLSIEGWGRGRGESGLFGVFYIYCAVNAILVNAVFILDYGMWMPFFFFFFRF